MNQHQAELLRSYYKAVKWINANENYKNYNLGNAKVSECIDEQLLERWIKINNEVSEEYFKSKKFKEKIDELMEKIDKGKL